MYSKKICKSCGAVSSSEVFYCSNCGEALQDLKNLKKDKENKGNRVKCKKCGSWINKNSRFCDKCGNQVDGQNSNKRTPIKQSVSNYFIAIVIFGVVFVSIIIYIFLEPKAVVNSANRTEKFNIKQSQPVPDMQKIDYLKEKIGKNPSDANLILQLANLYHDYNAFESAIQFYKKYLEIDGKNVDARIDMAICYFSLGDNKNAISEIRQALKFSPGHQKGYYNLGVIFLNMGDLKESMANFRQCYEIDPGSNIGIQAKELLEQHKNRN